MSWLLDTNSIIYIQKGLIKENLPEIQVYISVITRMELLSYPNLSIEERLKLINFLSSFSIIPLDQQVEDTAIDIRLKYKLKLPDSIIVASAICMDSILVSNDSQLEKVKEINLKKLEL
ncbi:MAG: type II toxin-antitoxin system VapC family toxin [Leptospiraceae bacterium]|nr:type II toxin-antitoxin system VapC family toxin [Leptospiraceae bacterium]